MSDDDDDAWEAEFPYFDMYTKPTTREELQGCLRANFNRALVVNRHIEEGTRSLTETCPREFSQILQGRTGVGDVKFDVRRYNSSTQVT